MSTTSPVSATAAQLAHEIFAAPLTEETAIVSPSPEEKATATTDTKPVAEKVRIVIFDEDGSFNSIVRGNFNAGSDKVATWLADFEKAVQKQGSSLTAKALPVDEATALEPQVLVATISDGNRVMFCDWYCESFAEWQVENRIRTDGVETRIVDETEPLIAEYLAEQKERYPDPPECLEGLLDEDDRLSRHTSADGRFFWAFTLTREFEFYEWSECATSLREFASELIEVADSIARDEAKATPLSAVTLRLIKVMPEAYDGSMSGNYVMAQLLDQDAGDNVHSLHAFDAIDQLMVDANEQLEAGGYDFRFVCDQGNYWCRLPLHEIEERGIVKPYHASYADLNDLLEWEGSRKSS